jgi:hypothetical protein
VANGYAGLGSDGKVPASQLPESTGTDDQTATEVAATPWGDYIGATVQTLLAEIDTALRALISAIPTTLAGFPDDETHRLVTDAEKSAWNTKQSALTPDTDYLTPAGAASTYVPTSTKLPTAPPTSGRQIIQAVGGCSLSIYDNQADCETNSGVWTVPYSVWTSVISGLINDLGLGVDDLWSAAKIAAELATKQAVIGYTPENAAIKGVANGYAGLGADGKVPASQLPESTGTDDQVAAEVPATPWGDYIGTTVQALMQEIDTVLRALIPTTLAELADDTTHRLVTDTEKSTWNDKQAALTPDTDYLTPGTAATTYQPLMGSVTVSTSQPSGGSAGDIWYVVQ